MHYKKISLSQNLGEYVVWKIRRKMGLRFEWNQIIYAILSYLFQFAHINGTPPFEVIYVMKTAKILDSKFKI